MQIRTKCPACQTILAVDASSIDGALVGCPQCGREFALPAAVGPSRDPRQSPYADAGLDPSRQQAAAQPPASQPMAWLIWAGIGVVGGIMLGIGCLALILVLASRRAPADPTPADPRNLARSAASEPSHAATASGDKPATAAAPSTRRSPAPSLAAAAPAAVPPENSSDSHVASHAAAPIPVASAGAPTEAAASAVDASKGAGSTAMTPADQPLAYCFKSGEEYAYSFSVQADVAGAEINASGINTLMLSSQPPQAGLSAQVKQGSGSGFVVTSDGYIVTCAHVVAESTKIEVVLGADTYPAQMIAFDRELDLAIVHIAAAKLPTIALADSDAVELGQEVRVIGFPLSHVLGESVKITRGTVAGVVDSSGRKLFQVDASVNPGNSGGPLVNDLGQVVGIASAKLTGEDIDGVGFALPANEVLSLLRSKGISPPSGGAAHRLDGAYLARAVTPAVALIKVTTGPGGFGAANRLALDYSGSVTTSGLPRVFGQMSLPGFSSHGSDLGQLLLTERGEVLNVSGNGHAQLPYLLGPIATLPIEPLGDGKQRSWQFQHATTLTQVSSEESNDPFSLRFRHRSPGPFGLPFGSPFGQGQTKVVVMPAMETNDYELSGVNGDLATIVKRHAFQTLDPSGTRPAAKMTGEGTITFNRGKGCAETMDFRATLVRTESNVTVTIPVTMQWRLLSKEELEKIQAEAQANLEAAKQAHEERLVREAKGNIGEDTEFVGGKGGSTPGDRYVDDESLLYGIECRFSQWADENCVSEIVPIFARDHEPQLQAGAVARDGYAVGAMNVKAEDYVNGIQLIFMRIKDDGKLNPKDAYASEWLGAGPLDQSEAQKLGGDGDPIIGIHLHRGLVVDAMALVVNRNAESNPFAEADYDPSSAPKREPASPRK